MWGLPYRTHSVLLAPLCDITLPLEYYCIGLVFLYESVWIMKTKLLAMQREMAYFFNV